MKTLTFALLLTAPLAAQAELEITKCSSKKGDVQLLVATHFAGSYEQLENDTPAEAAMRIEKKSGPAQASIALKGTVNNSAKGPYFELAGTMDGKPASLFISAVASKSPSELEIAGKKTDVYCD